MSEVILYSLYAYIVQYIKLRQYNFEKNKYQSINKKQHYYNFVDNLI